MTELQNYIDGYGFGISVKDLCSKAYWQMKAVVHAAGGGIQPGMEAEAEKPFFQHPQQLFRPDIAGVQFL